MEQRRLQLSILDQSPAAPGETPAAALQHTLALAQRAEEWGYHRFWVAEHHGSDRHMGSSPEVLMAHLLARTNRLRIGSGGVMLQHYSPYKVAENFNVLASLAPGRVDLGIGRGPGGMPKSTQALRPQPGPAAAAGPSLADKVVELRQFLHNQLDAGHPLAGLQAMPRPPQPADLFLLGTTAASGEMAAQLALPYVFAYFLNGDETEMRRGWIPTANPLPPPGKPRRRLCWPCRLSWLRMNRPPPLGPRKSAPCGLPWKAVVLLPSFPKRRRKSSAASPEKNSAMPSSRAG